MTSNKKSKNIDKVQIIVIQECKPEISSPVDKLLKKLLSHKHKSEERDDVVVITLDSSRKPEYSRKDEDGFSREDHRNILRHQKSEQNQKSLRKPRANDTWKKEHARKIKILTEFMTDHYESTAYFYEEMERILNTRQVRDDARKMLQLLDKKPDIKSKIMRYFRKLVHDTKKTDIWSQTPNDLVINIIHDF